MELDIATIIGAVVSVIAVVLGGLWTKGKGKLNKVKNLAVETVEVISKLDEALADNKVTKEEVEQLKKEAADVKIAWKALFAKEIVE